MRRRDFIWILGGSAVACVVGCAGEGAAPAADAASAGSGSGTTGDATPADAAASDGCVPDVVTMHDTYAQALYFDGTLGPLTGVVTVAQVIAGAAVTMDFWHGHGGQLHRFTLEPEHFAALTRGERITIETTMVDSHSHLLFVDPVDETYRVEDAPDVDVSTGC